MSKPARKCHVHGEIIPDKLPYLSFEVTLKDGGKSKRVSVCAECCGLITRMVMSQIEGDGIDPRIFGLQPVAPPTIQEVPSLVGVDGKPMRRN
jgi:hypothetical protein